MAIIRSQVMRSSCRHGVARSFGAGSFAISAAMSLSCLAFAMRNLVSEKGMGRARPFAPRTGSGRLRKNTHSHARACPAHPAWEGTVPNHRGGQDKLGRDGV